MHNVFISYHHQNDQVYKDKLILLGTHFGVFQDKSVNSGEISEDLNDQAIRKIIRDDYLKASTVTILLAGQETKSRKHIDWEIYSSMFDGSKNKKSGILVINLPSSNCEHMHAPYGDKEKSLIYPHIHNWTTIDSRAEYEWRYPDLPERIIDNLVTPNVKISIVP